MPVTVTNQNFSRIIFSGPNPVLLYFSSPENEISRRQDTILRLFAHEHPEIVIGRINTRKEPSLAAMYGIETIPSIKIFKNGKCTATRRRSAGQTADLPASDPVKHFHI